MPVITIYTAFLWSDNSQSYIPVQIHTAEERPPKQAQEKKKFFQAFKMASSDPLNTIKQCVYILVSFSL